MSDESPEGSPMLVSTDAALPPQLTLPLGDDCADLPASPLQQKFRAPRDGKAWLFEPTHTYVVNGTQVRKSVTGLIKKYWPQFQPEVALQHYPAWKANKSSKYGMLIDYLQTVEERDDDYCKAAISALWAKKGKIASEAGTAMHLDFQRICEGGDPPQGETPEVRVFRNWLSLFCKTYDLEPWRAEWVVYYEHEGRIVVAGQIDLVLKHTTRDEYWCVDYKRRDPAPKYPGGPKQLLGNETGSKFGDEMGSGPFKDLPHNDFAIYTTQLNAYGHIAAKQYGVDFRDKMCLLQIHPDLPGPNLVRVERMDDVMEKLFALETAALPKTPSATDLF
jgi:hypothetical protein